MSLGHNPPLYLLPLDHRHSYVTGMFKFNRQEAMSRIAERYREWAAIFDRARTSSAGAA